ncbi:hypothetical protein DK419_16030 [Methylobacterium terrae]|uniref:Uncharacterized protein n=2 Tax=Methylobacterium terrae TaxID=2202827 RepID=A0A2U8WMY8_9HYPH|nr:hypothetical protein DK419_16030 [Methylobacterium terrae]
MAIVENDRGFAVEVQKYHHDRREGAWFKSGAGLTVYASRIPAVIAALEGAHRTITSLERAKRQVA